MMDNETPEHSLLSISCVLQLDPSLATFLAPTSTAGRQVRAAIEWELGQLMLVLGAPGEVKVDIEPLLGDLPGHRWLRLHVNKHLCRYSNELLPAVQGYVQGQLPHPDSDFLSILSWLNELAAKYDERSSSVPNSLVGFLTLAVLEIVKSQPAVLLGLAQVTTYVERLLEANARPTARREDVANLDPSYLLPILQQLVGLRVSIANTSRVLEMLEAAPETAPDTLGEQLITALRPSTVEIRIPEVYLRELLEAGREQEDGFFPSLRGELFDELGLTLPEFSFIPDPYLRPYSFAIHINHLPTLPYVGLWSGQCLVNDTVERLQLIDVTGVAVVNPATGQSGTVVGLEHKAHLKESGFTTWDAMEYLMLCLGATLRKHAACFVDSRLVERHMKMLDRAFPALVKATEPRYSKEKLARLLRELVAEDVSIRNLRQIFERLLDNEFRASTSARWLVLDDVSPAATQPIVEQDGNDDLLAFVRAGLKEQIGYKFARETQTIVVYLLDPEIESILSRNSGMLQPELNNKADVSNEVSDRILMAIEHELGHLPKSAQIPSILVFGAGRSLLRSITALHLPRMAIISYRELAPGLNVQPVARISFL